MWRSSQFTRGAHEILQASSTESFALVERWSSAGRVLTSDSRCKYTKSLMLRCYDFQPLYAILRHFLPKLSFGAKLTCLHQNNCNGCCRGLPRFALLLLLIMSVPFAKETKSAAARTEVDSSSDVKIMQIRLFIVFYFIERINE